MNATSKHQKKTAVVSSGWTSRLKSILLGCNAPVKFPEVDPPPPQGDLITENCGQLCRVHTLQNTPRHGFLMPASKAQLQAHICTVLFSCLSFRCSCQFPNQFVSGPVDGRVVCLSWHVRMRVRVYVAFLSFSSQKSRRCLLV